MLNRKSSNVRDLPLDPRENYKRNLAHEHTSTRAHEPMSDPLPLAAGGRGGLAIALGMQPAGLSGGELRGPPLVLEHRRLLPANLRASSPNLRHRNCLETLEM